MNWNITSILSLVLFSLQYFFYKVATEKRANLHLVTFSMMTTIAIAGSSLYLLEGEPINGWKMLLFFGFIAGTSFVGATLSRLKSLEHMPSSVAFLIFDFKVVVIALISIFLFKDLTTPLQTIGIFLALVAGGIVIQKQKGENEEHPNFHWGIIYALGVVFTLSLNAIVIKQAIIENYQAFAFIMVAGFFDSILSFLLYRFNKTYHMPVEIKNYSIKMGILVGIINFSAFYFEFISLQTGSLAVVTAIISFSTFGAIILSTIFFKEKIGFKRGLGLAIGLFSLFLLR